MAIRPVSVSFRNNYNLAFEGRKKKNSEQSHVSSPVKAVPLAVLLAMSPLNVDGQNVIKENIATGVKRELADGSYRKDFEYVEESPFVLIGADCEVAFVSTDGDDIPETVKLKNNNDYTKHVMINGVRTPAISKNRRIIDVKALRIVNVTKTLENGEISRSKRYYAVGDITIFRHLVDKDNPKKSLAPMETIKHKNSEVQIHKEFYDRLAATMGDNLEYQTEDRTL